MSAWCFNALQAQNFVSRQASITRVAGLMPCPCTSTVYQALTRPVKRAAHAALLQIRQDGSRPGREPVCCGAQASTPLGPASSLVRPLGRCGMWLCCALHAQAGSCAVPVWAWSFCGPRASMHGRELTQWLELPQAKPMASRAPGLLPSSQRVRVPPPRRTAPFCARSRAPLLLRRAPSLFQTAPCQQTPRRAV